MPTASSGTQIPKPLPSVRNRYLLALDVVTLGLASLLAFSVRFENIFWIRENVGIAVPYLLITVPVRIAIFYQAGLYRQLWRHASIGELRRITVASVEAAIAIGLLGLYLLPGLGVLRERIPFSVAFLDAILTCAAIAAPRIAVRAQGLSNSFRRRRNDEGKRTLIVGAGNTGKMVAKELMDKHSLGLIPVGFIDDDHTKHNHTLCDIPVLGSIASLPNIIEQHGVAEIIIAMPSAPGSVVRQVVRAALDCGIPTLTVPSLPELLNKNGDRPQLREVEIQDLLRREPVETDLAAVAALATKETVLITGAGGSIGSELCRQVSRLAPQRLVIVGHGENSIFDICQELTDSFPDVEIVPIIADVRDRPRMTEILKAYRPHAVFHAAAHKHVPLMEENVIEAVTNNVIGTRNVVDAALEAGTPNFVLVSTDKAVRPTSVMGATKRVAEQIVQLAAARNQKNFVSVRFGNVLGSRGSVVPTFLKQIRAGGPVTVTHKEMQRYFMTIPEAVQLILQAGALGTGGEVFVLDMGEPVKVVDIAKDLIRLSGLTVDQDIKIAYTGIRPGEKLYEEMFFSAENVEPTHHRKVLRARGGLPGEGTLRNIDVLVKASESGQPHEELRKLLRALVPDFHAHHIPSPLSDGEIPMTITGERPVVTRSNAIKFAGGTDSQEMVL